VKVCQRYKAAQTGPCVCTRISEEQRPSTLPCRGSKGRQICLLPSDARSEHYALIFHYIEALGDRDVVVFVARKESISKA